MLGLVAVPSMATVVMVPTLEEMAVASEVIAEVMVGDARVLQESPGRIVTYTTLEVTDGWKGVASGDTMQVFQLGGDLPPGAQSAVGESPTFTRAAEASPGGREGKSSWIVGAHRFTRGQRLVFFGVRSKTRAAVVPFGIGFGLFQVIEDLTGAAVIEIIGDVAALASDAHGKPVSATPARRRYDTLAAFKRMVLRAERLEERPTMPVREKLLTKPKGR